MLTNKIDMLKHESCQKEFLAIMHEFRQGLMMHFKVVDVNATRLINSRWGDTNG